MKVITLDNICKLVESKHGKQEVTKELIGNSKFELGIVFIHDKDSEAPVAYRDSNGELKIEYMHDKVHCVLTNNDLEDFNETNPFMKSREALGGVLTIDGSVPTEEELKTYLYKL